MNSKGLTPLGEGAIKEMMRLGMIIDINQYVSKVSKSSIRDSQIRGQRRISFELRPQWTEDFRTPRHRVPKNRGADAKDCGSRGHVKSRHRWYRRTNICEMVQPSAKPDGQPQSRDRNGYERPCEGTETKRSSDPIRWGFSNERNWNQDVELQ